MPSALATFIYILNRESAATRAGPSLLSRAIILCSRASMDLCHFLSQPGLANRLASDANSQECCRNTALIAAEHSLAPWACVRVTAAQGVFLTSSGAPRAAMRSRNFRRLYWSTVFPRTAASATTLECSSSIPRQLWPAGWTQSRQLQRLLVKLVRSESSWTVS